MRNLIITIIMILSTNDTMAQTKQTGHYANVNGLMLYYEIHGHGFPLVLVHGGGSSIPANFSYWLPLFSVTHKVIAVEMQAHGRTADIDRVTTFEQDADDIAALLRSIGVEKADLLGFSNGATTSLQVGIRHPTLVRKLVLASGTYKRNGMPEGFFEGMIQATMEVMPDELKTSFLKINPDKAALQKMFDRDKARMIGFKDIDDSLIRAVKVPVLLLNGDKDVVSNDHVVAISKLLPNAKLLIVPGGHGEYMGET
ncbi:MAG: alpha/beta hydrolase, partial [Flavitalea sp.]